MEPYQQRVVDEKGELDERLDRLLVFLSAVAREHVPKTALSDDELTRLCRQAVVMRQYSNILRQRIEAWG